MASEGLEGTGVRKRPPTTSQLLTLLSRVRVKTINKFSDPQMFGEWRPDDADTEVVGTIVIAIEPSRYKGADSLIVTGLHELGHAFYQVNCKDDRAHHSRVYRWEALMFRSRALREAMAIRIMNAYVYGIEDP